MTTVKQIYDFLDSVAPFNTQEDWDNSGFLLGDSKKPVSKIALALDVTHDTVNKAVAQGADLLISHHPVIFHPVKSVTETSVPYHVLKEGLAVISAHTCWDAATGGVNDVLAALLGLQDVQPLLPDENGNAFLRVGTLKAPALAEDFADIVAAALDTVVRVSSPEKQIQTVAVCGGSGASFLPNLPKTVDAFVTGDAKHNDFLDAIDSGIALFAAGHYETETVSMPVMGALLKEAFPDLTCTYIESAPVTYIG